MPRPNPIKACEDFHRTVSTARHREAGVTRRHFLRVGVATGVTLYAARAMPVARLLEGAQSAAAAAPEAPILVTVFLPGGLDLLDTLVPLGQYGAYRGYRSLMAQADASTPRLGKTGLGIHPSLAKGDNGGIKGLFDRGIVGFLPGIDYANPDLSHFHSRHFWETGLITAKSATGWLGRWLDAHGSAENPFQGLTSGYGLSPVLRTAGAPVSSVESVTSSELWMSGVWGENWKRAMQTYAELGVAHRRDHEGPAAARRAARLAKGVADQLAPFKDQAPAPQAQPKSGLKLPAVLQPQQGGYPANSRFADRLRQLAFLLAQPLGVRIATVDADGDFDTHQGQALTLTRDLEEISRALAAFQADVEARGLGGRVLTFVWSEFGRRPKANRSLGTDHGAGGVGWVQGVRAAGGILAEYPSLGQLDKQSNLAVTVDFRTVYASLIEQWLRTSADAVIPNAGAFGRITLVR